MTEVLLDLEGQRLRLDRDGGPSGPRRTTVYVWTVSEVLLDLEGQRLRLDRVGGTSGPRRATVTSGP